MKDLNSEFMKHIDIQFLEMRPEYAIGTIEIQEYHLNIHGYVHGGVYFTLADSTAGAVVHVTEGTWVTLNASFNYISAVKSGEIYAKATLVSMTRKTAVISVNVYQDETIPLCLGTFTMYRVNV